MGSSEHAAPLSAGQLFRIIGRIIGPERSFLMLAAIYGVGISLLSLATPIAVQVLINTVAYTGLTAPLVVLSLSLFGLLLASGLLNALRVHLMEIFTRRFYARMVSEIALRTLYAQNPFFADDGRGPLFNRYFDILGVQKSIPILIIGGFTVILQVLVGFLLVSFYHPLFLAFNLIVLFLMWMIWSIWGASAMRTAVGLSQRKHESAMWLEGLAASNGYFKSEHHVAYALERTDGITERYITQHKAHFRRHFAQTVAFLLLYAAASATLLGLGGWLVIQGQLTLGQLVAAELVLSAAFYGISQLGTYLNYFYDLTASAEELSLFWSIQQEAPTGQELPERRSATLGFEQVKGDARGIPAQFDLRIPGGMLVQAAAEAHGVQRLFTNLLKRFVEPQGGTLTLGGDDITATEVHVLRREVMVLDRPSLVEMPLRQYLTLSREGVTSAEMLHVLRAVGLRSVVDQLEEGLDTKLASTGWPLSIAEAMQLKLAGALLSRPRVLVLNQLFDMMPQDRLCAALRSLQAEAGTTAVVFTNRHQDLELDGYLFLEAKRQRLFRSYENFADAAYGKGGAPDHLPEEPRLALTDDR